MLKTQTINNMFQTPYKMNFIPPIIINPNQFMFKCIPQNVFFPLQDIYKGYTNSLRIKLPYKIDKTTLLNIFLFYGKIEFIDINSETNVVLIEYYKIISAIKCYSEFKFNFNKLINGKSPSNQDGLLEISFVKKNFEEKFHLGFKINEKELFKTKINTDCLIKIISKVGKILKIYQKMAYEGNSNNYPQQISLNTIFVFNDSRDKEKADFILRRIIMPYSGHNQNNSKRFEETKECKEDANDFLGHINSNIINGNLICNNINNNANNVPNFDVIYEQESNLSSFPIIYQYMKKDDEIELKDDYDINANRNKDNNINKNNNNTIKNEPMNNKENCDTINIHINKDKNFNINSSRKSIENTIKHTFPCDINKNKYTGIKQRNTPIEERAKYVINLEKIINEKDQRTTLMIKNIPRNIIQSFLMDIINKKFEGLFNFFYLPIDFIKKENAGYAFINFKNSKNIVDFYIEFNEKPWPFCPNRKCFISYARIQGFRAITQHFSSSNIMLVNNGDVKPYISDE
jgi:hypothetical protein